MRRILPLLACLPLSFVAYACEDSEGDGGTGSFDAGTGTFEAGASDVEVPDAAIPAEAGTGLVVNVRSLGTPVAHVGVVLHDATGAVIELLETDASGVVSTPKAPAMVTIAAAGVDGPGTALLTYLGITEGDVLNVEVPNFGPEMRDPVGAYDVTATGGPVTDAFFYDVQVNGTCFGGGQSVTEPMRIALYKYCARQNNALLGAALDINDIPLQYAFKKGEPAPAMNGNHAVALPQWTAPGTLVVGFSNRPPNAYIEVDLIQIADGTPFIAGQPTTDEVTDSRTFRYANGFADALQVNARHRDGDTTLGFGRRAAPTANMTFDLGTALPKVTNVTAVGETRPDFTITTAAPLTGADGGLVALRWGRIQGDDFIEQSWFFVVPPDTKTFKAPALPVELADYQPPAEGAIGAGFVESDVIPSYGELKRMTTPIRGPGPAFDLRGTLPTNGNIRVTLYNSLDFNVD